MKQEYSCPFVIAKELSDACYESYRDIHELLRAIKSGASIHERGIAGSEAVINRLHEANRKFLEWHKTTMQQ